MRDLIDPKTKLPDVFRDHDHLKGNFRGFCHDARNPK